MRFDDFKLTYIGPSVAVLIHSVYFRLGMDWRWDRFDWCLGGVILFYLARALWEDGQTLHHAVLIAPRERRWQCERAERRARRAFVSQNVRNHGR
jgi:hypothetical protein